MGKKNRKLEKDRKKKQESNSIHWKKVKAAIELDDPLDSFVSFKQYKRNACNFKLLCVKKNEMSDENLQWVFDLTKTNMEAMYQESPWGWFDKSKKKEMFHDEMRFLMVVDEDSGKNVAFTSFRFDIDFDQPVVYCYEIQLISEAQRKGLGMFMMQILQLFAIKYRMHKVVVTVLESNVASMNFFTKKLGYVTDDSSPYDKFYSILCKPVPRKPSPTTPSSGCQLRCCGSEAPASPKCN